MKDKTQKTKQVGTRKSGFSLMNLQLSLWMKIVIPIAVMAVLVLLVYYFKIPNPNMILIAGLVLCSAIFGYWGGAIAGVIMLVYTLYFFSTDHNFTDFSPENARKVVVSVVGICVDMFFVCALKNAENKAFKQVASLTEELRKENEELYRISFTDALTGLRNRMALKQDLAQYVGRQVTVLMLDVDRFKVINDTLGHDEGDRVLAETGALLAKYFGGDHCYRYGGDEFLIICPDKEIGEFEHTMVRMLFERPYILRDGESVQVIFSVGYVHDTPADEHALRDLCSVADERMYQEKRARRGEN